MQYRKLGKTNEYISVLGFGCMRLPLLPGGDIRQIDEESAVSLIDYAIDNGVNYFDTAYSYHGGQSEYFIGKVLKNYCKRKINLATKLPSWLIKTRDDMDKYLEEQLQRLQRGCIDFYLIHGINGYVWENLKTCGLVEFMDSALKDGRIKHIGFSFHDRLSLFKEIIDYYDWEFCQIQYNYIDQNYQAGKEGLDYAAERNLGVIVMEPLRGGILVNTLPEAAKKLIKDVDVKRSPAEWALRWIWNDPGVGTVLSGMNSMEQIVENIQIANSAEANSFSIEDSNVINAICKAINAYRQLRCTSCGYCMPCPVGVNIPVNFTKYNNYYMFGGVKNYKDLPLSQQAGACKKCGECETHCPQGIEIRLELEKVENIFGKR
jgi:predicted aldo/keto reductase-like oxidoreductase